MRTAIITINSSAIKHNLAQVNKKIKSSTKVLAMVKANAYGHGISNILTAFNGADGLGVASFQEAQELRQHGWDKTIVLIEGVFSENEWKQALQTECQSVIHNHLQLKWALTNKPNQYSASQTIWLKLNTGMNRIGFDKSGIQQVAKKLIDAGYRLILTSHFANADDATHPLNLKQITTFTNSLKLLHEKVDSQIKASLCNSAAIINFPECHYDWVRPGIMLYGSSPIYGVSANKLNLKQAMTFEASIIAIQTIKKNTPIGYGSQFVSPNQMIKGIVSIGYGDGYPRTVDDSAWVSVLSGEKRYKCAVIGRVSMDMISIDLTNVPEPKYGDIVTLWGEGLDEPSVDDIAGSANTIGYELLCRITQRPIRRYI